MDGAGEVAVDWLLNTGVFVFRYNADVQKIVDESVDKLDTNAWSQLKNKTSARDSAVLASEKAAQAARATIGKSFQTSQ